MLLKKLKKQVDKWFSNNLEALHSAQVYKFYIRPIDVRPI